MIRRIPFLLAMPVLLAACATGPTMQQRASDFQAAAGAPIQSFNYSGSFYSWEPLGDHSLVVYTRPTRAYLLEVGPCPGLPYTHAIGLSSMIGQVSVRFDKVFTDRHQFPCYIKGIRPVDVHQVRAAQEQRRQVQAVSRDASASKQ